jgi:hypothetical protein
MGICFLGKEGTKNGGDRMKLTAGIGSGLVLLALGMAGCGTLGHGKTIVKYEGNMPRETGVPANGEYGLYGKTDFSPKIRVHLNEGDRIGFRKEQTGHAFAVAGQNEYPVISDNTYYWKRE